MDKKSYPIFIMQIRVSFVSSVHACCKESIRGEQKLDAYDRKSYYACLDKNMVETPLYMCKFSLIVTNIQCTCNTNMLTRDVVHIILVFAFLSEYPSI